MYITREQKLIQTCAQYYYKRFLFFSILSFVYCVVSFAYMWPNDFEFVLLNYPWNMLFFTVTCIGIIFFYFSSFFLGFGIYEPCTITEMYNIFLKFLYEK